MLLFDNMILNFSARGKLHLYDLDLNYIKSWDYFNSELTTGGSIVNDGNYVLWMQHVSSSQTIYKKQFIDMTSDIV